VSKCCSSSRAVCLFIATLRFLDGLDLLEHPVEVAFEQSILHDAIFLELASAWALAISAVTLPVAKLDGALGVDFVTHGNNGWQFVVLGIVGLAVAASYSKISNNWRRQR